MWDLWLSFIQKLVIDYKKCSQGATAVGQAVK